MGSDLRYDGLWRTDIANYSVQEGSMSLVPGDMSGGASTITFSIKEDDSTRALEGKMFTLRDTVLGETSGKLLLANGNGTAVSVSAVSRLGLLNVRRIAAPYSGSLRGAILYYLGLCDVTGKIAIEQSLATRSVNFIGWEGNVLDYIKDLCAAQTIDLSLVGEAFVFRPVGTRTLQMDASTEVSWSKSDSHLAQKVDIPWHQATPIERGLIYPTGVTDWTQAQVFSVEAGVMATYQVDLQAPDEGGDGISAITVEPPTCVDSVTPWQTSESVYSVSGKDGLPIPPGQWWDDGGRLWVSLIDGGRTLEVKILGGRSTEYAPYSISMSSGQGKGYTSLRVVGQRMKYTRRIKSASTGVSADRSSTEEAGGVTGVFVDTSARADALLERRRKYYGQVLETISFDMAVFEGSGATHAFTDGMSVNESLVSHPFGNVEGSLINRDGKTYRVRSITHTPASSSIDAETHII